MSFRPQEGVLGMGWQTAAQAAIGKWIPADAIDRFTDADEVSLAMAIGRPDTSNRIGGSLGKKSASVTVLNPAGTFTVPLANNPFCLGILASHAGASKTGAIIGADDAWTQVIDPDQTNVLTTDRWMTLYWHKTNDVPELWLPTGIEQVVWNFPKGGEVTLQITPTPLENRQYGLPINVAGAPANHVIIRGWLEPVRNALADKDLWLAATAFSTPNATMKAEFGGTPAGANTFNLVTGTDDEFNPKWGEVITNTAGDTPIGRANMKFEAALLVDGDVTALDEARFNNPMTPVSRVAPTQPVFTAAAACLTVGGTKVADLEGMTLTTISDLKRVDGGSCRSAPVAHKRSGTSTCVLAADRAWTTDRHDVTLHDDSEVLIQIDFRHDTLVDAGGAVGTQFNGTLLLSVGRHSDGSTFKAMSGAQDDQQGLSFDCEPASGTPQWRYTCATDFVDLYA